MTIKYVGDGKPIAQKSLQYLTTLIVNLSKFMGEPIEPSLVPIDFKPRFHPLFDLDTNSLEGKIAIPSEKCDVRVFSSHNYHGSVQICTTRDERADSEDELKSDIYIVSYAIKISADNQDKIFNQEKEGLVIGKVKDKEKIRFIIEYLGIKDPAPVIGEIGQGIMKVKQAYESITSQKK